MTLGEFCKAMINRRSVVIRLFKRCNSEGEFGDYMCDTNKDTSIVEMVANKEIRAFKITNNMATNTVCIALRMDDK